MKIEMGKYLDLIDCVKGNPVAEQELKLLMEEIIIKMWQPIETAPKTGQKIILARFADYVKEKPDGDYETVKNGFCWAISGFWSEKYNNWNDGLEPSGLNDPTHWMPVPNI